MSTLIELNQLHKHYCLGENTVPVLENIDLSVEQGEMIAIMGASGSGKSTLLNILGLLDRPTSGSYTLEGKEISTLDDNERAQHRNHCFGFVFQSFFLLPRLNALQNISLPLQYSGIAPSECLERSKTLLAKVAMSSHGQHKPTELSGGQQQRVAIARALVNDPKVILADEPTGALDSTTGQEVMDLFLQLNKKEGTTIIVVTHDEHIAKQCQRTVHIKDGVLVGNP